MRSYLKLCLLALSSASIVFAQTPTAGFDVFTQPITPGSTYACGSTLQIAWTPSAPAGKITILLLEGTSNITLEVAATPVASGIDSTTGTYDWNIPTTLGSFPVYGFKLQLDSDNSIFQYSTFFSISCSISGSNSTSVGVSTSTTTLKLSQVSNVTTIITSTSSCANSSATTTPYAVNSTITTATIATNTGSAESGASTGTPITYPTSSTQPSNTPLVTASKAGAMPMAAVGGTGLVGAMLLGLGMML